MAAGATVRIFEVNLSDIDRGIYETLELKVAQHPSEDGPYLIARVLAYLLEYEEYISFSGGLSCADEPAVWVRDLTGQTQAWIEVGTPSAQRLHKARKAVTRVCVYCHKDESGWLRGLQRGSVYQSDSIRLFLLPRKQVQQLARGLERRNHWSVSRMEGQIYLETPEGTVELEPMQIPWPT